jgi:hypothetical protein
MRPLLPVSHNALGRAHIGRNVCGGPRVVRMAPALNSPRCLLGSPGQVIA